LHNLRRKKGSGPICRNGPQGASHKLDLTPFFLESRKVIWTYAQTFSVVPDLQLEGENLLT
jgi:hypothetical protein